MNWKYTLAYVDDAIVFSNTFEQHLRHLQDIFTSLTAASPKIKPSKCCFAAEQVYYLGYLISKEGVTTDPSKVKAVQDYPIPVTEQHLRSFLCLCSYYRRFVRGYSHIAAPLFGLVNKHDKGTKITWSEQCQAAFQTLKDKLISAPVLAYPAMNAPFILTTDASGDAIGFICQSEGR